MKKVIATLLLAGETLAAEATAPAAEDGHGIPVVQARPTQVGCRSRPGAVNPAGDLMAEGDRSLDPQAAGARDVKVRMADAAAGDADADLRA